MIHKIPQQSPPPTGAYYRVVEPHLELKVGDLVLAWTDEDGDIHGKSVEHDICYSNLDEFLRLLKPAPEGRAERLREFESLMAEANADAEQSGPLLLEDRQSTGPESATALVTTEQRDSLTEAKRAALTAKQKIAVIKERMDGLLEEQKRSMELAAAKWEKKLNQLTYAITSINLYLGRDEQITCIQEGENAPADQPIAIRQTILFLDEETALHVEDGGLDFKNLSDLDAWLCRPENLQQILPETKGIIALQLRRGDKYYANASVWEQMAFNQANGGTYILVRNGNRLWRIWNDIKLPAHLFPTKAEFDELFIDSWTKEPVRPGTKQYQRALDAAEGRRKLYLQAVLLLQGLLDRTRIFHPLPVERVNLFDPEPDPKVIRLIRDGENLLSSGRPSYNSWLRQLNQRIEVGKRIIFGGTRYTSYSYESRKEDSSRTRPRFADWPERHRIYTVSGLSDQCRYTFPYPREGFKSSATFHFYPGDPFVLNFDDAQEEDMLFYMGDRCNRHHYLTSMPLLSAALRMKREEQERERPFIDLMVREAAERSKSDPETIRTIIQTVIPWWKQQNRVSRSLTQNEKAAYHQILREVRLRLEIGENPATVEAAARIQQVRPDWLLIAKDSRKTLVCLRHSPLIAGLVIREEWNIAGDVCLSTRENYMPDSEHGRWEVLAAHAAWAEWPKHGRRKEFLSPGEYESFFSQIRNILDQAQKEQEAAEIVAITANESNAFVHGMFRRHYTEGDAIEWACKVVPWTRDARGEVCPVARSVYRWTNRCSELSLSDTDPNPNLVEVTEHTFAHEKDRLFGLSPETRKLPFTALGYWLVEFNAEALKSARKRLQIQRHKIAQENSRWASIRHYRDMVQNEINNRFWDHEKQKYLADGGIPDLWDDHKKTIKRKRFDIDATDVERCIEVIVRKLGAKALANKTMGEAWTLAATLDWKPEKQETNQMVPANIVLVPEKT